MKILTSQQLRDAKKYTLQQHAVNPRQLSQRAARAVTAYVQKHAGKDNKIFVFCGKGDNGADGIASAIMLHAKGLSPKVYLFETGKQSDLNADLEQELRRLQTVPVYNIGPQSTLPAAADDELIIDALLGSGIRTELEPGSFLAGIVEHINKQTAHVVSLDLPSGMQSEQVENAVCVKADHVIALERPRVNFFLKESYEQIKSWEVAPLGLDYDYLEAQDSPFFYTTGSVAAKLLSHVERSPFAHKHELGHVLIAAGSKGKIGAATLAVQGAQAAGAGLVTAHVPACGYEIMQLAVPEAITSSDRQQQLLGSIPFNESFNVYGIGPGIGTNTDTAEALDQLLAKSDLETRLVLDADALNIIAKHPGMLESLPPGAVLTPHPGEFRRLAGDWEDSAEMLDTLQGFVAAHGVTVVLKGHYTAVATASGQVHFNTSGNAGMATAGSGDVLLGIIAGLIAQGWTSEEAAILGVYLHGLAGDLAVAEHGVHSLRASHLSAFLGKAFMHTAALPF